MREMILRGTHWAFIRWGQLVQPLWKAMWRFLKQFNTELRFGPAIPLLDTYPKEMKTHSYTKTGARVFRPALFQKMETTQRSTI